MSATDSAEAILLALAEMRAVSAELRAVTAFLRRHQVEPALIAALADYFGKVGRFNARGLLQIAEEEPHSPIGEALGALIDMNAPPRNRAVQLGTVLSRMKGIEVVAKPHGSCVYRLRLGDPNHPTHPPAEDHGVD